MNHLRISLLLTLTLLLAACGGNGPIPAPPTETPTDQLPPPTTPNPITPVPINPAPPEEPDSNVPYYGEWRVLFVSDSGVDFTHSLNITERAPEPLVEGGFGLQEFCIEEGAEPCDLQSNYGSGFGFMGGLPLDDGTTPLSMAIFTQYSGEDAELKIFTVEDIVITTDAQGRDTFEAASAWDLGGGDLALGTISATHLGAPRILDPLSATDISAAIEEQRRLMAR